MGYSGARGTLIYEKNLKAKISCQTPFKRLQIRALFPSWFSVQVFNDDVSVTFHLEFLPDENNGGGGRIADPFMYLIG